ncbi:MAG: T9SS type A sorting domain-containing protein [Bacteroidetes bacterium]|nr:T9SS type A sorting domain-containing protein [Bacteroidota bacterium]MDE2671543.1 T9SS type A sorting domain-containing protein [Bacteroidota bacterium]
MRALHLETTGDTGDYIKTLAIGASGNVYVVGSFRADRAVLGADTLYARGGDNLFIAKYGATPLSSEPSAEVSSRELKVSNYPNPFRQRVTIKYRVPALGQVRLTVYDVLGRELAVLVDEQQRAGSHSAKLDASSWPSGVYLYRLEVGNQVATDRLVRHK